MSVIEMIITVALFTVLMLAIMNSVSSLYKFNSYTFSQAFQVQYARKGVEALVRDVREMTYADNGAYPLVRMEPHVIGFYSDIDRDNSVEYVEYELSTSTILTKRVYNATSTATTTVVYNTSVADETYILSEYVQNIVQGSTTFSYFDSSGIEAGTTTQLIDIRYVQIYMTVNVDIIRHPGKFQLRSSAALRNLKDNL